MPNFSSQMLFHHLHFLCLFYVAALVLLKMLTPHSPTKISNIISFATETTDFLHFTGGTDLVLASNKTYLSHT